MALIEPWATAGTMIALSVMRFSLPRSTSILQIRGAIAPVALRAIGPVKQIWEILYQSTISFPRNNERICDQLVEEKMLVMR
jgi:hypothetical protein